MCGSGISSYFPDEIIGGALFADGSWRMERETICYLAFAAGGACAGAMISPPRPPAAIELTVVRDGFEYGSPTVGGLIPEAQGFPTLPNPSSPDFNSLPGTLQWVSTTDPNRYFSIQAEVLTGISALTPDVMTHVLTAKRFGVTDGTPVTVSERPVRIAVDGAQVALVVIRANDVAVQVHANGLTDAEVDAIAAAIRAA